MNNVTLIGNLTKDPQLTKTQSGLSLCKFTLAVKREYSKDESDFISCIAWKQTADYLSQYGHKGDKVSVVGSLQTGSYDDKDGKKVYTTDVNAQRVTIEFSKERSTEQHTWQQEAKQEKYTDEFDTGRVIDIKSDELPF